MPSRDPSKINPILGYAMYSERDRKRENRHLNTVDVNLSLSQIRENSKFMLAEEKSARKRTFKYSDNE